MMTLVACVLHSEDGCYGDDLVCNAASCLTSIFYSISGLSPDFIPQVAVFRADPLIGCHCLYKSTIPDSNHAINAPPMPYMAFSPTFRSYETLQRQEQNHHTVNESDENISANFRGRSAVFLNECLLLGTRATPRPYPGSASAVDAWSSLAGGILTSLAFFNKHITESYACSRKQTTELSEFTVSSRTQPVLLIFSHCAESSGVYYNTECAMAVSVMTAMKLNVQAFTFGKVASDEHAGIPGCSRVRAFTVGTGGFCADSFSPSLLGKILDKLYTAPLVRSEEQNSPNGFKFTDSIRIKRDHLIEAYVIAPSVMPQSSCSELNRVPPTFSNLAWLCPRCMTVTDRTSEQGLLPTSTTLSDEHSDTVHLCEYCEKLQ